jgi:hypothetical protein
MKTTTKAIFSLGLISFLTLGGICQNAFAAQTHATNHQHSVTKKTKEKPAKPTSGKKPKPSKAPSEAPKK